MGATSQILDLAKSNNGIVTTEMVVSKGIYRGNLKYLVDKGVLQLSSRGVYNLPDSWEDEFVNLQSRFKKGVFSLGTALYLCDLTDRTPAKFNMTFPGTYNLSGPKAEGIACNSSKKELFDLGIILVKTPAGNLVRCYGPERSLCDIVKSRNSVDIQLITEAFKRYVRRKDRNIPLLSEYACLLKVEKKIRAYLEVLL